MTEMLLTPAGFERLNREYAGMCVERARLVVQVRAALESGGAIPENGEYLDARHELALLEQRMRLLEERLLGADVVDPLPDGELEVGERVTLLDLENGATFDYRLVGAGESDPAAGAISYLSPIGAALLGRRVGDVVEADAPSGRRQLEIVELDG